MCVEVDTDVSFFIVSTVGAADTLSVDRIELR